MALLAFFCIPVFFVLLGQRELAGPDEGRLVGLPGEMARDGDWAVPGLKDVVHLERPPFVFLCVAVSRALFGDGEFALRLPVALFASLGILLTYATGRRLFGHSEGFLAAVVLGTSLCYVLLGRFLIPDMIFSVLVSGALACFILAMQEPPGKLRRGLCYGLYVCAALATLSKGLTGFLVPGAIMLFWLLGGSQWHRLRPLYLPAGGLLFLVLAAPWHILAALRNAEWAESYLINEHWLHYTMSVSGRIEPWWYFGPVLIFGFFPWVGFLPRAIRSAWSRGDADKRERATTGFLLTWAGCVFVFFSLSSSKLAPHILPMFPPLALLVGRWLARRLPQEKRTGGMAVFSGMALTLALAIFLVVSRPGGPIDADTLPQARPFLLLSAAALFVGALVVSLAGWRVTRVTISAIVVTFMVLTIALELLAPRLVRPGANALSVYHPQDEWPGDMVLEAFQKHGVGFTGMDVLLYQVLPDYDEPDFHDAVVTGIEDRTEIVVMKSAELLRGFCVRGLVVDDSCCSKLP